MILKRKYCFEFKKYYLWLIGIKSQNNVKYVCIHKNSAFNKDENYNIKAFNSHYEAIYYF